MLAGVAVPFAATAQPAPKLVDSPNGSGNVARRSVKLCLAGDVMTGRGIDQILAHPSAPGLHEPYARSALDYVDLAERRGGPLPRGVTGTYLWGDTLPVLDREDVDARIVNLETAVTDSEHAWPGKDIHYRMHPANVGCLSAAHLDCCTLANNHVLDWGYEGLAQTLRTLRGAGVRVAGAGRDRDEARMPAVIELGARGRVLVFAAGLASSGIPKAWGAGNATAGVWLLPDLSPATVDDVGAQVALHRHAGDVVVMSLHWGGNWGHDIAPGERAFAHALIDDARVDVVSGHSSHHAKAIEVHRGKPILYGCGDLLDDYEGIGGHENYRPELGGWYLATLDAASGALSRLALLPTRIERFRVNRARDDEARWLAETLSRHGRPLGTSVESGDGVLDVRWR